MAFSLFVFVYVLEFFKNRSIISYINLLPYGKFLGLSKLNAFAEDKMIVT